MKLLIFLILISYLNFVMLDGDEDDINKIIPFPTCWGLAPKAMKKATNKEYIVKKFDLQWPQCGAMPKAKRESN